MQELVSALHKWRRTHYKKLMEADPHHRCPACADSQAYFGLTKNLSTFGNDVCPCERRADGLRKLSCVNGTCSTCRNMRCVWSKCTGKVEMPPVKYKWLRAIQIGNRADTEWAWMEKPYEQFEDLLVSFFEDSYRLHNWVYKWQELARRQCRRRLNKGCAMFEVDYAAKMTLFGQDAMPCSAAKQTSNFVMFVHFAPNVKDGKNLGDTTEVFAFHSDCVKQDTHSIRRCFVHVMENLKERGHLSRTAHVWADGCGSQNKGRKAFRQMSELSVEMGVDIIANFACSHHFAGPWDTEGGRQHRAITRHVRNDRGNMVCESFTGAADNVKLLRRILNKAGTPDLPPESQKFWRPSASVTRSPCARFSERKRTPIVHQSRGRTQEELAVANDADDGWYEIQRRHIWRIEPCPCQRLPCTCPKDDRLTYVRDENYDCTAIAGTMSTYCYKFSRKALHVGVRQFSCYCRWCCMDRWERCDSIDVVRHAPDKPVRPRDGGYVAWRNEGWRSVVLTIKSAPDRAVTRVAVQSLAAAREYVDALPMGSTIAFFTTEGGKGYWLGSKQSQIRTATSNDVTTGVKRGEEVFDIVWYECVSGLKYRKLDYETVVSVSSVLVTVSGVSWNRTTTNRYYVGETTHNMLIDIVDNISEL